MPDSMSSNRYPMSMRMIHWTMAVLVIGLIAVGLFMASLPFEADNKFDLYPWHRAFGVLAFVLLVIRYVNRRRCGRPPLPGGIPWHEQILSGIVHALLYLGMVLIPVIGYVASSAMPTFPGVEPVNSIWFFGIELPIAPVDKSYTTAKFLINVHAWLAYIIIGAVALHVIGAIKHRFFDKRENDVLSRIL